MSIQIVKYICPECNYVLQGDNEPGSVITCTPPPKGTGCGIDLEVRVSLGAGFTFSAKHYHPRCPKCGKKVEVSQSTPVGTVVECPDCHQSSSVVLELAPAPPTEEDFGQ